ncbi:TIGR02117 family protein [Salinimicrobium sp. GXAS 041]|uniref:TIGR02117 family protein n=1 Tax=Salinimicrobium sp. GXAS 041 TaxID=3400806 RepID=UPI003C79311D
MGAADVGIKVVRFLAKGLFSLLFVTMLYLVAALIGSVIPVNTKQPNDGTITIYLRTNGVHTDFIFPIENEVMNWKDVIPAETIPSKMAVFRYISFGWGDLEFYKETKEWSDLRFPVAFQSVFLNSPSALHVTMEPAIRQNKPTVRLDITKEQYEKLVDYVYTAFQKDAAEMPKPVKGLHYNQHDAFFHAKGSLHFFYTCNTWINDGLKYADLRACLWTPFDEGIFYQYN